MKLLKKYRTYTYTSLVFAIIIGFISNYHLFKYSNQKTTDEVIYEYRTDIEDYANNHHTLRPLLAVNSKFGEITLVDEDCDLCSIDESIKDTLAYDHYQDEMIVHRKMIFPVETRDGKFLVRLMLPTLEDDYLLGTVIFSIVIFSLLFILFTTVMDLSFTRQIFKPFHMILELMKTYNIEKRTNLELEESDIDEFKDLNRILTEMMNKINEGYYEMKDFLEYTSHELQTPLSIIQLKLELLNQQNIDNQETLDSISSVQSSLNRVIRFNRSILFIAKINNNQYVSGEILNLNGLFEIFVKQYEEMLMMKNISVTFEQISDFTIRIHPLLAEHLVQNIVINAIKHNYDGGNIRIYSSKEKLIISNTFKGKIPNGDLFEKYNRSTDKRDSSGLGLTLVKTICVKNNINVKYIVEENVFKISLSLI